MSERTKFGAGRRALAGALLGTLALLTSGCARPVASGTEAAVCDALRADLPTWSRQDTERSRIEGARFVATFDAVCG